MDIEINTNVSNIDVEVEKAGPQGLSAYQVAVKNGFVGTEQEWLDSLVGEKGEKGDKGDKGDIGEKGQDGTNGKDGKDGAIQYTAGDNITIENNVISAIGADLSNYYNKSEVNGITGSLNDLDTEDKSNLVSAINELANASGGDCNVTSLTENADMRDLPTGFYKNTSNNQIIVTIAVVGNYTVEISVDDIFYWNNPIYYNPSSTSNPGSMLVRISRLWGVPYKPSIEMYYTDIAISGGRRGPYYAYKTTLDLTTVLNIDGTQTITGTKTFNNLPQSSVAPSSDNQLVNKKYVDDSIAAIPSSSYTAGEGIDINNNEISLTMPIYLITDNTSQNPFIIENAKLGIYIFGNASAIYLKGYEEATNVSSISLCNGFIILTNTTIDRTQTTWQQVGYAWGTQTDSTYNNISHYSGTLVTRALNGKVQLGQSTGITSVPIQGNCNIFGIKTFNALPESSITPTNNNQLVNKSYVDNAIASAITDALGGSY